MEFFSYNLKLMKQLEISLVLTILMLISETAFFSSLFSQSLKVFNNLMTIDFQTLAAGKLLYFSLSRILIVYIQKLRKEKRNNYYYVATITPMLIFIVLCIYVIRIVISGADEYAFFNNVFGVVAHVIMIVVIGSVILYERSKKKEEDSSFEVVKETQEYTSAEYIKVLQKQNEDLAKQIHDEKNHLYVIKNLESKYEVERYIDSIVSQINTQKVNINTKNPILDILIQKYKVLCEESNIIYTFNTQTANLNFMLDKDIVSLIDNLLENAIEASIEGEKKIVELSIAKSNDFYCIKCINTYCKEPVKINGQIVSTKRQNYHGYGTKIIESVVKKYNGYTDIIINTNNKTFCYSIIIPVNE